MKYRMTALILALTVASWAQTATQNPPAATPQNGVQAKTDCACCEKTATAGAKEESSCCAHHDMAAMDGKMDGKEAMACCAGKDAKSCCGGKDAAACKKNGTDKTAGCGKCSDKDHMKSCCNSAKKGDKSAMNCCGDKQCARHGSASAGE
jgi:hypothetical protein